MSSSELSDPEFDLSCSESSADLSPEFGQSSDLHAQESCLMEYRLLSTMEARSELQWLHDSENRMWRSRVLGALTKAQSHLRQLLVDTLCVVRFQSAGICKWFFCVVIAGPLIFRNVCKIAEFEMQIFF